MSDTTASVTSVIIKGNEESQLGCVWNGTRLLQVQPNSEAERHGMDRLVGRDVKYVNGVQVASFDDIKTAVSGGKRVSFMFSGIDVEEGVIEGSLSTHRTAYKKLVVEFILVLIGCFLSILAQALPWVSLSTGQTLHLTDLSFCGALSTTAKAAKALDILLIINIILSAIHGISLAFTAARPTSALTMYTVIPVAFTGLVIIALTIVTAVSFFNEWSSSDDRCAPPHTTASFAPAAFCCFALCVHILLHLSIRYLCLSNKLPAVLVQKQAS
eukprot:TRINITY_DN31435_c0_g1_i1.p1 TRINITY_DN31435_c0_g1~~TRINITY_DN31435_c0_g1_i1.p1  ORF type:complete len:282 (+),score=64.58 TRINITY_DN31435_c0_g1_i1:36-848(+)